MLIANNNVGVAITGTFAGAAEGVSVFADYLGTPYEFQASYIGGDGNDFTLTAVPEPGSAAMLLGGLAVVMGRRRRRA